MHKIVQLRPLTAKEIPYARALKPFEDEGLVDRLYDPIEQLEFLIDITKDTTIDSANFEHVLMKTHKDITPAEIYEHILLQDEYIPPLFIVFQLPNNYKNIYAIKTYKDIQKFVHIMHSKGVINGRALIKGPNENNY